MNNRLHTDSIKNDLLPALNLTKSKQTFIYPDEADLLNKIVFGQTAIEWRQANPKLAKSGKNQRDYATIQQQLIAAAQRQYLSLVAQEEEQKKLSDGGSA